MRFEVRYPKKGVAHKFEFPATLAVLGRDPSCDLVLNDSRCSRRHAVVEAGPDGLTIRDTASANGVYVNGRRVERAALVPGDEIRLGAVVIDVLAEPIGSTLVVASENILDMAPSITLPATVPQMDPPLEADVPPRPARPAAPARPAPPVPRRVPAKEALPRPLAAMTLAALWLLSAPAGLALAVAIGVGGLRTRGTTPAIAVSLAFGALGIVVGAGLWQRAPWARALQIALAAIGVATCIFTPISAVALGYMLTPGSRIHFSGRRTYADLTEREAAVVRAAERETLFAAGALGALLLSVVLAGLAAVFVIPALASP